jgi:hypothetical protein
MMKLSNAKALCEASEEVVHGCDDFKALIYGK